VNTGPMLVTLRDIEAAAASIAGIAVRTPLIGSAVWPTLRLKPENLQPIGAFKLRGALHALARLPDSTRAAGVVAHSSGNHGQAVAYAARRLRMPCAVVMPDVSAPVKVAAVRALGADVHLVPVADRLTRTQAIAADRGMAIIPPYDHRDIIAGAGTVGLEIAADAPALSAVLVPVGGGGLASGVATAVKALSPSTLVIGVEPELAADAVESLATGSVVRWTPEQTGRTCADGLRTNLSELTLAHLLAHLDGIVTVTEEEILSTVGSLARTARIVAEPSGATAPAAYLHRRAELVERFSLADDAQVVAVISGGNLDPALLAALVARSEGALP
jgi:threonine dehydratase